MSRVTTLLQSPPHGTWDKEVRENEAYYDEKGVIRWSSNDRVPPREILEFNLKINRIDLRNFRLSREADEVETRAFLQDYARREAEFWASTDPKDVELQNEQRFEMRAAFGPDAEVVNILTGHKVRT